MIIISSKILSCGLRIIGMYPRLLRSGELDFCTLTNEEFDLISIDGVLEIPNGRLLIDMSNSIDALKYRFITNNSQYTTHKNIIIEYGK